MTTRNVSFPPAAASAFGSRRKADTDFPSGARDAFSKKMSAPTAEFPDAFANTHTATTRTTFNETASSAFGRNQGRQSSDFGLDASAAFGKDRGPTGGFDDRASQAFGKDRGTTGGSGGFDDRASQAFSKKSKRPEPTSSAPPVRGNTLAAHFSALLGDSPGIIGRTGSALFKKKDVPAPVLTQEEMFPALKTTVATEAPQKTPSVKMTFADLARKRAQEDEAERIRAEKAEADRQLELQRRKHEQARFHAVHSIRNAFAKKHSAPEEEEEFHDEGEAYIRPEDMEDDYHDGKEELQDGGW